jgi:hypothetical protein
VCGAAPAAAGVGKRHGDSVLRALVYRGGIAVHPAAFRSSGAGQPAATGRGQHAACARWGAAGWRLQQRQAAGGGLQAHPLLLQHAPVGSECHTSNRFKSIPEPQPCDSQPGLPGPWRPLAATPCDAMAPVPQVLSPSPSQRLLHRSPTMGSMNAGDLVQPLPPGRIGGRKGRLRPLKARSHNKAFLAPFRSCSGPLRTL